MSRRKLVRIASGAAIVLVVAISSIPIISRPSQETEAASSEEETSEEESAEEESSEDNEGAPASGSDSPWMKIAGWKLTLTVTGKGSWEDFDSDGLGQRGAYSARYAASVVLTNLGMMWMSIPVLPGVPMTGVPGVQPQPAEFSAEFDQRTVRKTVGVCGEGIGTALETITETSKGKVEGKGGSIAHAELVVNIAKGTYGFNVAGGVEGRVEKKVETEGGCAGPDVRTGTISETRGFTLGGPSSEGKIEFQDLPLPSGPTALSSTRPLPPEFFTINNPFGGSEEGINEAIVSWTFSPLGDR